MTTLHGWYSASQLPLSGSWIYGTPDGRTVEVTYVTESPDHGTGWRDIIYVGPVLDVCDHPVRRARTATETLFLYREEMPAE